MVLACQHFETHQSTKEFLGISSSSSITGISTQSSRSYCCGCSDVDVLDPLSGCLDEEHFVVLELLDVFCLFAPFSSSGGASSPRCSLETDISQKDEKPSKKRQNRTRDGKVCEDEAQSKSSQLREEKAKKNIT
ncbi:hypothetical protein Tco_0218861 [Tanacetum coccineum]